MMTIDEYEALDRERLVIIFPRGRGAWVERRDGPDLIAVFPNDETERVHLARLTRYSATSFVLYADGGRPPPPMQPPPTRLTQLTFIEEIDPCPAPQRKLQRA